MRRGSHRWSELIRQGGTPYVPTLLGVDSYCYLPMFARFAQILDRGSMSRSGYAMWGALGLVWGLAEVSGCCESQTRGPLGWPLPRCVHPWLNSGQFAGFASALLLCFRGKPRRVFRGFLPAASGRFPDAFSDHGFHRLHRFYCLHRSVSARRSHHPIFA